MHPGPRLGHREMRSFGQDLVVACRTACGAPSRSRRRQFSRCGLGIAGVGVLLAFIQGGVLRPLPMRDQDRVIRGMGTRYHSLSDSQLAGLSAMPWKDNRRSRPPAGSHRQCLAYAVRRWPVMDEDSFRLRKRVIVTGSLGDVLGNRSVIGGALSAADDEPGSERVIVIKLGAVETSIRCVCGSNRRPPRHRGLTNWHSRSPG